MSWSKRSERCTECGTTKRKHYGGGLCARCYGRASYRRNPEPQKRRSRANYQSNSEVIRLAQRTRYYQRHELQKRMHKGYRDKRHFGGLRERALRRDKFRCRGCGRRAVVVHHKDRRGRGNPNPNNVLRNLLSLCRRCHLIVHREELGEFFKPGEDHLNAKLTTEQVIAIRNSRETHRVIANRYGVSREAIGQIKRRVTWKHIS